MNWEVRTMRSKTSCFNSTLFKKNLSRYWPLWGLGSFGGAMFPLAMLVNLLHGGFQLWSPLETTEAYYTVLSYAGHHQSNRAQYRHHAGEKL